MTRISLFRIISCTAIALLAPAALTAAKDRKPEPSVSATGVTYLLPKTRIRATVRVTHSTFTPGELSRYADRYLRLSDIGTQYSEEWKINDIAVIVDGVPDTRVLYGVEFGKRSGNPVVRLTSDGILQSVNAPYEDLSGYADAGKRASTSQVKNATVTDAKRYLTEEILLAGSSAKMAELVAKEIYDIRESRNLITRGQADYIPADGESAKYILQQLEVQEQSLLTMFTGTVLNDTVEYTFECVPDSVADRQILFRFSTRLGVLETDNLAGEPVWIDVENRNPGIQTSFTATPAAPAKKSVIPSRSGKQTAMLFYRVPGTAEIRIYNNRRMFVGLSVPFAQFGRIATVPQTMFSKGKSPVLVFNTNTGALQSASE